MPREQPPRGRLASDSGSFVGVNPARTAAAVAELEVSFLLHMRDHVSLAKEIADLEGAVSALRLEVISLQRTIAVAGAEKVIWKVLAAGVPIVVSIASMLWAVFGK